MRPKRTGWDGPADGVALDRVDCLRLLSSVPVGRVLFTEAALPAALPVAHLLDNEEVLFRAEHGSGFAAATRNRVVAFQADGIDAPTRRGWSVVGVGEAYEVLEPGRLVGLASRLPVLWHGPAGRPHTISLPLQHLSGHGW
jgi:nitroimidazol reductase NimA-like FMN-containing flavoprotein (pyridoxamine 5'-phosphate oxidase superfamily)